MMYLRVFAVFLCVVTLWLGNPQHSVAQGVGITLIPATIEQGADPGEVITRKLTVTNISPEEKEYFIYKRNIKGVGGGGVPIFAENDLEATGYEISEWISFEEDRMLIGPGEKREIPVIITVPETASPGSHFGGVFVSVEPPRLREIGAGVGYEVASIISIRISGDVIDDARIRSFATDKLFYSKKLVQFDAKVENKGNILIRPRGPLTITNVFNDKSVVITVNDNQAGVFPNTSRDFSFTWEDESLGFGRYEAVLALAYEGDGGQKTIDASLSFWIFPLQVILPVVFGVGFVLLVGYFLMRTYVRRAIAQAGGRRVVARQYRRQVGISKFTFVAVALLCVLVLSLLILFVLVA